MRLAERVFLPLYDRDPGSYFGRVGSGVLPFRLHQASGQTGFRVPQAQAIAACCVSREADSLHRFIRKADARVAC